MDIKLILPGMKVLIDRNCELTRNEHGFTDDMEKMEGTTQVIQHISTHNDSVIIKNFNWSPENLTAIEEPVKIKKQPTVHFDMKDLVI